MLVAICRIEARLRDADAFLAAMSFGKELDLMMRPSFTAEVVQYFQ